MVFSIFVIPFLLLSGSVASSKSSVHEHHRRQQKATTAAARKTTTREKSIDVSLVSSLFPATSRALETAEAISTCCGEEKFWQFVRVWRNQNALNGKRCQRFIESAMRRAVGGPPEKEEEKENAREETMMTSAVKMSVGLRQFAPRLKMFQTLKDEAVEEVVRDDLKKEDVKTACCFATVGARGRYATDVASLRTEVSEARKEEAEVERSEEENDARRKPRYSYLVPTEFDHAYPTGKESDIVEGNEVEEKAKKERLPMVYLYAATGSQCFLDMHEFLAEKIDEEEVRYVLRPVFEKSCLNDEKAVKQCTAYGAFNYDGDTKNEKEDKDDELLRVPGFGVELAIKNMEYKAVDDQITAKDDEEGGDDGDEEIVLGFNFKTLRERLAEKGGEDAQEKLDGFKKQLEMEEKSIKGDMFEPLPKWKIANLGLLATQKIVSANDPLSMLRDVTQNFPSLMNKMANTMRVQKKTRDEVKENQRAVPPSSVIMSLNGQPMELDTVDAFAITDRVISELRDAERVRTIGLGEKAAAETLHLRPKGVRTKEPPKIDVTFSPVEFSYDFEKDKQYEKWSKSYSKFLKAMMESQGQGGLPPIRRNLINIVAIVNLGTAEGMEIVNVLERYRKMNIPVRYAILAIGNDDKTQLFEDDDYMGDGFGEEIPDDSLPDTQTYSNLVAKCAHYILAKYGAKPMRAFAIDIIEGREQLAAGDYFSPPVMAPPKWEDARSSFIQIARAIEVSNALGKGNEKSVSVTDRKEVMERVVKELNDVLDKMEDDEDEDENKKYSADALKAKRAIESRGLESNSVLINGVYYDSETSRRTLGASLSRAMGHLIGSVVQNLQQAIHTKQLKEDMDAYAFVNKGAAKKLRPEIQDESAFPPTFLPEIPHLFYISKTWIEGGAQNEAKPVSIWVVANPDCALGKAHLSEAMKFLRSSYDEPENGEGQDASDDGRESVAKQTRFFFVNPQMSDSAKPTLVARAVVAATQLTSAREHIPTLVLELLKDGDGDKDFIDRAVRASGVKADEFRKLFRNEETIDNLLKLQRTINAKHLGNTRRAFVVNGRLLDPVVLNTEFDASDLHVVAEADLEKRSNDARKIVERDAQEKTDPKGVTTNVPFRIISARIAALSHFIAKRYEQAASRGVVESLEFLSTNRTAFTLGKDDAQGNVSMVEIEVILDPLSKEAQRIAPVLKVLKDSLGNHASLKVIMNPVEKLSDVPLSSYFRYCAQDLTDWSKSPKVVFEAGSLPQSKTLTAHLDHPEPWMVTTKKAKYDLDNLILENVKEDTVFAEYSLESLLVTGHAFDGGNPRNPPRGTQVVLQKKWFMEDIHEQKEIKDNTIAGTIIMANLGYFQLPASPGRFALALKEGRSRDVYEMVSTDLINIDDRTNTFSSGRTDPSKFRAEITVASWSGKRVEMKLRKRAGFEMADVLSEDDDENDENKRGLGSKISSLFGGKNKKKKQVQLDENGLETIHIFSVATGHLYERFLKIMMASVRRHTKNPLKFWFIKNWLSPSFKDFLPHFAKKYNVEYELITYKWPTWLHKQTEKQRIIWAYKILFLDVIFPLSLEKVVFVDADQIVRGDMNELWNIDLQGAPYGYTPMCDNNKEMEGFRFWKQGFWKTHLRGKPYHISALYVVDLKRFRELAAGDQLRGMYDQLSKDPGSLANLDQDLPNFAQHQVPIFSLPMPWLWCESWCGNETKAAAKTIDLCNNPLTKEPKLVGAARIVSEWTELDNEVRAYTSEVEKSGLLGNTKPPHDEL